MLSLTTKRRDELLTLCRKDPDPELRFRAHIILSQGEGHPRDAIEAMLFCTSRAAGRWLERFQAGGSPA
jgi:putative transposase